MKICFLCNEYPPGPHGGIGTLAQSLGRALVRSGHEVRVVGGYPPDSLAPARETDEGVQVWRLRQGSSRPAKALCRHRLFRMISRWSRAHEIDVVEAPDWEGWVAGWPALPVPVVVRLNGTTVFFADEAGGRPARLTAWLERASLRRADAWCAASRYVADRTRLLFALGGEPGRIQYNAVELHPLPPESRRVPGRVVFSGRLIAKKGVESLLRAWPRVVADFPGTELHLYGRDGPTVQGGSMRDHLRSLLAGRDDPCVVFFGHVGREELRRALETASVAIFPSFAEAFALAPMEAMAAGCATVSSRRGSGPELITHGRDGLLVDPGDPREIAAAITRLLADDALRRSLATQGRRRIESSFSLPVLERAALEFYRDSIEAHRARSDGSGSSRAPVGGSR